MFIHGPFSTGIYLDAGKLSSIDDKDLEFVRERKPQIRECHKESIPSKKRIIDGIKLVLNDYKFPDDYKDDFKLPDDCKDEPNSTKYKFENNTIYFYECGTALFSTQVTVTFQDAKKVASIASVKKAENFAKMIVTKKFKNQLLSLIDIFSEIISKNKIQPLTTIKSRSFTVGHLDWLHTVYHFCNPDSFGDNWRFRVQLKELLDQVPHEMSSSMDRYVFITDFGSETSIIITKKTFSQEKKKISRLVRLLETYQYFYYALYQLDTFLLKEMYNEKETAVESYCNDPRCKRNRGGERHGPHSHQENNSRESINKKLDELRENIDRLNKLKSSTIRYLEQFRYGSNALVISGERSLNEELEKQWDVDRIEKGIRNKLDLFGRELSSNEQKLLAKEQEVFTNEQKYLNKIILVFTVITVGSLTAQIVELSPERDFELNTIFTKLLIVLILTVFVVVIILYLYSQRAQGWRIWKKSNES